ncbi:MAG: hypothetical protein IKP47_07775 [Ruminococcus sp.]|nr:hypothetical protein [Ruminococcus sp.]
MTEKDLIRSAVEKIASRPDEFTAQEILLRESSKARAKPSRASFIIAVAAAAVIAAFAGIFLKLRSDEITPEPAVSAPDKQVASRTDDKQKPEPTLWIDLTSMSGEELENAKYSAELPTLPGWKVVVKSNSVIAYMINSDGSVSSAGKRTVVWQKNVKRVYLADISDDGAYELICETGGTADNDGAVTVCNVILGSVRDFIIPGISSFGAEISDGRLMLVQNNCSGETIRSYFPAEGYTPEYVEGVKEKYRSTVDMLLDKDWFEVDVDVTETIPTASSNRQNGSVTSLSRSLITADDAAAYDISTLLADDRLLEDCEFIAQSGTTFSELTYQFIDRDYGKIKWSAELTSSMGPIMKFSEKWSSVYVMFSDPGDPGIFSYLLKLSASASELIKKNLEEIAENRSVNIGGSVSVKAESLDDLIKNNVATKIRCAVTNDEVRFRIERSPDTGGLRLTVEDVIRRDPDVSSDISLAMFTETHSSVLTVEKGQTLDIGQSTGWVHFAVYSETNPKKYLTEQKGIPSDQLDKTGVSQSSVAITIFDDNE